MAALSELRKKKLTLLFNQTDTDQNGALEQSDYERYAAHFAMQSGHALGGPEHTKLQTMWVEDWNTFSAAADSDHDGKVKLDEFLAFYGNLPSLDQVTQRLTQQIVSMIDRDGDGKLAKAEYVASGEALIGKDAAEAQFGRLDRDRDGFLTREEVSRAVSEFFMSEDPSSPGNTLLGPLD